MTGEIEWLSAEPRTGPSEPVAARRLVPLRWLVVVVPCAALALAIAFALPTTTTGHGKATALPAAGNLALIHSTATDPEPLTDFVRPTSAHDACAQVAPGALPQRSIASAIHTALPGYSVRDVGRTLDEFAALCNLTVRASDTKGSVLVVAIAAPEPGVSNPQLQITVGTANEAGSVITAAQAVTTGDWTVTVGTLGPPADQPSITALEKLAEDPTVRW